MIHLTESARENPLAGGFALCLSRMRHLRNGHFRHAPSSLTQNIGIEYNG